MSKKNISSLLLEWYAKAGRDLPWRIRGGPHPDPYMVLVSEFMLQQTGVKTVVPYFLNFIERFPTIGSLAAASQDEIYKLWQGLGYYSRARSLHTTAKTIVYNLEGFFPQTRKDLMKLKGIGPYTAASILSLAFNKPETVVDGNVIRVICRLYGLHEPVERIMTLIQDKAWLLADKNHPADYASAIMDLGATVCTPKKPLCPKCPWCQHCLACKAGNQEKIPVLSRMPKRARDGRVYLITNPAGEIFITRREGKGLLSGLYEFPWKEGEKLPFKGVFKDTGLSVSYTFTHFKLQLHVYAVRRSRVPLKGLFIRPDSMKDYAFSSLMKKVYATVLKKGAM